MAKTAVVTGGGSGIGKAVALALAASEYQVCHRGSPAGKLEEVASEHANGRITPVTVEVIP